METLVLIAHPTVDDSPTQSFLKASGQHLAHVHYRLLDQLYPTGTIDVAAERAALAQADQVIFQFPLYWYSAPASLKQWLDQVLQTRLEENIPNLAPKTLGLVVSLGTPEKAFVAGGTEGFTLSEILRPYQALAQKLKMTYRVPLVISQFNYLTEAQKMALLITYQQYLTMTATSFDARTTWFVTRLQQLQQKAPNDPELNGLLAIVQDNQEQLQTLKETIAMMKGTTEHGPY